MATGTLGDAVIWWQCDLPAGRSTAVAVARPPGKVLGPETQLPIAQRGDVMADLAVAPTGRATAVSAGADGTVQWWRGDVGDTLTLSARAALTTTERIDLDAGPPRIAVSATGDALSAWTDLLGRPRAAPVAADLGVGAPVSLGDAAREPGPVDVAVGDGRQGVAAWYADGRIVAAQRAATGGFGPAATISGSGWSPRTARLSPATMSATPWRSGRGAPRAAPWWSAPSRRVSQRLSWRPTSAPCLTGRWAGRGPASPDYMDGLSFRATASSTQRPGRARVHHQAARHRSRPVQVRLARSGELSCSSPSAA